MRKEVKTIRKGESFTIAISLSEPVKDMRLSIGGELLASLADGSFETENSLYVHRMQSDDTAALPGGVRPLDLTISHEEFGVRKFDPIFVRVDPAGDTFKDRTTSIVYDLLIPVNIRWIATMAETVGISALLVRDEFADELIQEVYRTININKIINIFQNEIYAAKLLLTRAMDSDVKGQLQSAIALGEAAIASSEITALESATVELTSAVEAANEPLGWDAGGASVTDQTPYDAGWRSTDPRYEDPTEWGTIGMGNILEYRDNLFGEPLKRVFIHPKSNNIFSYPVELTAGKIYLFSCSSAKMSGDGTRPSRFSINSKADGTGVELGYDDKAAPKWPEYAKHSFIFSPQLSGTYYILWQTNATDNGERGLAWDIAIGN